METFDTSAKIKCLLEMTLKGEMTWVNFESLIDGLTLNFKTSKQVNRILLKEFENHQSICTLKKLEDGKNNLENDVVQFDEDQSIEEDSQSIGNSNSEEDEIQMLEQRKSPEIGGKKSESDDLSIEDIEMDFLKTYEKDQSESNSDFEGEEVNDGSDASKNIQILEAFKGQFYTFVGDDSDEQPEANSFHKSFDQDEESNKSKKFEVCFKENRETMKRKKIF